MSFREIVSRGNDVVIERADRQFGGEREELFKADGESGDVSVKGVKLNGAAAVLVAKKKLTAAQVVALAATPVEVIGKPAAGKFIEIISVHAWLDFASAAYDAVAATDYLQLRYTNASGAKLLQDIDPSGFGDAVADAHLVIGHADSLVPLNAKVVASLAGSWYTAAGDSPIVLEVLYRLRDLNP